MPTISELTANIFRQVEKTRRIVEEEARSVDLRDSFGQMMRAELLKAIGEIDHERIVIERILVLLSLLTELAHYKSVTSPLGNRLHGASRDLRASVLAIVSHPDYVPPGERR